MILGIPDYQEEWDFKKAMEMVHPYMVNTIHLYTRGHILAHRESCQGCSHKLNAHI